MADWGGGIFVLYRGSSRSLLWAMGGCIMHRGIVSSCQSDATVAAGLEFIYLKQHCVKYPTLYLSRLYFIILSVLSIQ